MKTIAKNKRHLKQLIRTEIVKNGLQCNLNHIDVSNVKDLSFLFSESKFNKNVSNWNVSNVKNMYHMFFESEFNQDISDWKPLSLKEKIDMFKYSVLENKKKIPYWS